MLRVGALVIGGFGLLLVLTLLSNGHETETRGKQPSFQRQRRAPLSKKIPEGEETQAQIPHSQAIPKGPSKSPKRRPPQPPKRGLPTTTLPTTTNKYRAPNPQVYIQPVSQKVNLVFPTDDETAMVASLRTVDDRLSRPSDMHALILESGEDDDSFSQALHQYQERTYTEKHDEEELAFPQISQIHKDNASPYQFEPVAGRGMKHLMKGRGRRQAPPFPPHFIQ